MLASSGSALAVMITGTIDGVHTDFYQEDVWQIISDITPDTRAERKLLSRSDKKFVRKVGIYQKSIDRLLDRAEFRELGEKQVNRLLLREDRLVQLLHSRNFLDSLLTAGLDDPVAVIPDDQTYSGVTGDSSGESQNEASVPEPSTLALLALGLLFIGVARGKHAYLTPS